MGVENNIPVGWSETSLDEICSKVTDGSHQSPKSLKGGLPMLSVKDMGDLGFDIKNSKKISRSDFNNLVRQGCKPEINDVLIAKDGSVLKHIFAVKKEINAVLLSSIAIVRPIPQKIVPEFLVYTLVNPRFKKYILNNFLSGSGVPRIVLKDFKKIEFIIPPLPEQKAIAKVLTAFDDKIELLQAQNKTLETMAQTIFKEWFGKYQIGDDLPEGWRVGEFGELFDLTMGLSPKGDSYNHDMIGVPLLNGAGDYSGEKLDPKRYTSKPTRINKVGDLVFCIRGTIGKIVFANKEYCLGRGVAALSPIVSNDKYFNYIKLNRIINELTRNATGSVILGLSKDDISKAELILPARERLDEFSEVVRPLFNKLEINQNQIQSLTNTRDTLLPKLMSGQVRVKNIKHTADA